MSYSPKLGAPLFLQQQKEGIAMNSSRSVKTRTKTSYTLRIYMAKSFANIFLTNFGDNPPPPPFPSPPPTNQMRILLSAPKTYLYLYFRLLLKVVNQSLLFAFVNFFVLKLYSNCLG